MLNNEMADDELLDKIHQILNEVEDDQMALQSLIFLTNRMAFELFPERPQFAIEILLIGLISSIRSEGMSFIAGRGGSFNA